MILLKILVSKLGFNQSSNFKYDLVRGYRDNPDTFLLREEWNSHRTLQGKKDAIPIISRTVSIDFP